MSDTIEDSGRATSAHVDQFVRKNLPDAELWPILDFSNLPKDISYPEMLNCAQELLDKSLGAKFGNKPVLHFAKVTWTYNNLYEKTNQIARVLVDDLGLIPGQRVLLRGANSPMMIACWFAVVKAGGVCVSTMPLLRAAELDTAVDKAEIGFALCDIEAAGEMQLTQSNKPSLAKVMYFTALGTGKVDGADLDIAAFKKEPTFTAVDTAADDPVLIAFTSGTTGAPKGAVHFHRDIMAITDCFPRHVWDIKPENVFCGTPPIAFTFGLGALVAIPMRFGASAVLLPQPTPEAVLSAIEKYKVTDLFTAPTMYRRIRSLLEGQNISSLQRCNSAGEPLMMDDWKNWHQATGIAIVDQLGSTEMLHNFIASPLGEQRPGSIGKAVQGYETRVFDDSGQPVAADIIGKLAVRGPVGCRYLDNEEKQREYVQDGWNVTGDLVRQDADGYIWYVGRGDGLIVSSGYNISAIEVEQVLMRHPGVEECAVIGVADEARGQIVHAFIVVTDGTSPDQALVKSLQTFVKDSIAPYKYPRAITFLDHLPKTETGKTQRFKLNNLIGKEAVQ